MDERLQEDWLDIRLREEAAYIDDAGFTAGVAEKLPVQRVRRSVRATILLGITVLASVTAYLLSGGGRFVIEAIYRVTVMPFALIVLGAIIAGVLVMAGGIGAAISKMGGQRLR
jgi:hypothetical protein